MIAFEVKYENKDNENKIKIFNDDFVRKNNNSLKIIYKEKEYPLCEYLTIKEKTRDIYIKLIVKKNIIPSINEMFKDCELLNKINEVPIYNKNENYQSKYLCYEVLKLVYKKLPLKDKIKIFGENFVNKNKNKCFIRCANEMYPLKEFFSINPFIPMTNDKLEILLLIFEELSDKSYMFHNCYFLEKITILKETRTKLNNGTEINVFDVDYEYSKNYLRHKQIKVPIDVDFNNFNLNFDEKLVTDLNGKNINKNKIYQSQKTIFLKNESRNNFCKDMSFLFYGCTSLISLTDISEWNTSNVTNMSFMFYDCSSLISLPDISKWNINKVSNMEHLFSGCLSLKSLPDLSKWDITNTTNLSYMFFECSSLLSLPNISNWITNKLTNISFMFCYCSSINSIPDLSK